MKNRWLRGLAWLVGGIAVLILAFVATANVVAAMRARATYDVAVVDVPVSTDSATVARGEHLVRAIGKCAECHGEDLGGNVFIDDPGLGRLIAPNLTTAGAAGRYTDGELARAIRHGVRKDGTGLKIMPSSDYNVLSDADVGAIIAYVRTRPPVTRDLPPNDLHFLAKALWTAGQLPMIEAARIDHGKRQVADMPPAPNAEYGRYLADAGGCTGCHGPGLSGGKIPGTPPEWKPAANITPTGIGSWTLEDFTRALREGRRPNGTPIDTIMPWRASGQMTDEEITAVYAFLKTVPPREFGNR